MQIAFAMLLSFWICSLVLFIYKYDQHSRYERRLHGLTGEKESK